MTVRNTGGVLKLLRGEGFKVQRYDVTYLLDTERIRQPDKVGGRFIWTSDDVECLRIELRRRGRRLQPCSTV